MWSFASPQHGDGFIPEFFEALSVSESKSFWFLARNKIIVSCLERSLLENDSFLEVGCGTGFVLEAIAKKFPNLQLVGSEYFSEGLPFAHARVPRATLIQADAREMPFANEFDAVGAFDVLEHIEDDAAAISSLYRTTRSGGFIILTVPQHPWLWSSTDEQACHHRRYTRKELLGKLKAAGFQIEYATSFVTFLLPVMFASRMLKRSSNRAPLSELALGPVLNVLFGAVMTLERLFIRCGISFSYGGSLLVVGKKEMFK